MDSSLIENICSICPVNAEWKFNKADLMDLMESENGYLNGKCYNAFNMPGLRYFIRVYPNGHKEEQRGETRILFLCYGYGEGKVTTEITVTNESSNYSKKFNSFFDIGDTSTTNRKLYTSEFFDPKNNFFVNGEFTIKVEGILKVERPLFSKVSTPLSMRWKIKAADLKALMEEESNDAFLCSEKINVPSFSGFKYCLAIYPNKVSDENEPETFIYLLMDTGNEDKTRMTFEVFVDSAKYSSAFRSFYKKPNGGGYCLCSTSDLFDPSKKFMVNGYLTIELKGILMKEKKQFVSIFCKNGVAPKSAWKKNHKDFMIVVGEKQIEVHKHVLMKASPILSEILESGTKESTENKLSIEDFSFRIVEAAVKLCYRKNGCRELIFEEMLSLFKFAKKYRIQFMMDSVEEYLIKKISPSNVVCLIKFSAPDSYNISKLYQSCIDYMIKCSKHSNPVFASECLDEKLLAEMYLKTLHSSVF